MTTDAPDPGEEPEAEHPGEDPIDPNEVEPSDPHRPPLDDPADEELLEPDDPRRTRSD